MNNKKYKSVSKKPDKTLVIIAVVSVLLVVGIVLAIILPDRINGAIRLNEYKKFIDSVERKDAIVVLSSPLDQGDELLSSAGKTLRADEAYEFVENVKSVSKNIKYSDTDIANNGIWKYKIVIYSATDEFTAYMDENGIYLSNNGKLITYSATQDGEGTFNSLYETVEEYINN